MAPSPGRSCAPGHDVTLSATTANPEGAAQARDADPALADARVAPTSDAVADADLVVLAVPFPVVDAVLASLAPALAGRVVIDATNPVGHGLTHGLQSRASGAEHVAALLPGAHIVKAFSVYGFENLRQAPVGPAGMRPVIPIAGDDVAAKATVASLLDGLGWESVDAGGLAAAVDLEHLTLFWVRMVRGGGQDPHLVWAALRTGSARD